MRTNKEMQLKILNKMIENVEKDYHLFKDIEYYGKNSEKWLAASRISEPTLGSFYHRVKPETIKVNGVEIPKPLAREDLFNSTVYFYVSNVKYLFDSSSGRYIKDYGINFVYETKEEAIEASKLLFGLG